MNLADVIGPTTQVLVYDGGLLNEAPEEPEVVLRVDGPREIAELLDLVRATEGEGMCRCLGSSVIEFRAGTERLAVVGVHHGQSLRWSGWRWDATLVDGRALLEWLAAHGYRDPLERLQDVERRRAESARAAESWARAAPEAVRTSCRP